LQPADEGATDLTAAVAIDAMASGSYNRDTAETAFHNLKLQTLPASEMHSGSMSM
jgi:hypothetical protein